MGFLKHPFHIKDSGFMCSGSGMPTHKNYFLQYDNDVFENRCGNITIDTCWINLTIFILKVCV